MYLGGSKMKNKIIAILTITCIIASTNLIGCAQKNNENNKELAQTTQKSQEKPEEFIEKMYKGLIDNKFTYENIWDDYFSETSKDLEIYSKEKYVSSAKEYDYKNNIVRTDIMVVSSEQIKENIFKVKSILKYTENGKEMHSDLYEYVIKENNKFKYLLNGIMSVKKQTDTKIENINYKNINVINYVDGIGISTDIVNQYSNGIKFGWVEGSNITLKTDKGEYSYTPNTIQIQKGQTQNLSVKFNNAEGTPQELTINNVNYLDNGGLPIDQTGGKSHKIVIN